MDTATKTETNVKIEYHADDFGMFPAQSRRILQCQEQGVLNGISVMPNGACLAECMELLRPVQQDLAITVHLNVIEGRSLCPPESVPLLTDSEGVFRASFARLLLHSYLPDRKEYREQLKKELRAQIHAVRAYLQEGQSLRLDGHAHYHMVPVVFDALMDVIREEQLEVSYIRIPREHPSLYLRNWRVLRHLRPINLVKVAILNVLAGRNLRKYREVLNKLDRTLFLGVFLSGRMFRENIQPIMPDVIRLAKKKDLSVEILAHPGGVYEEEDIARLTNREDLAFLTSEARRKEAGLYNMEAHV